MRALPGALLDPRRIALIGASGDAARLTAGRSATCAGTASPASFSR
jgi:hypothetical protein